MGFVSELKQFEALKKRASKVWLIEELDFVVGMKRHDRCSHREEL